MKKDEDDDGFKNNDPRILLAFSNRTICGKEIEPFCEPTLGTQQAYMIAAATNLVWWAMHEALADGKTNEAIKCGDMMLDMVRHEVSKEDWIDAKTVLLEIIKNYNEPPTSDT